MPLRSTGETLVRYAQRLRAFLLIHTEKDVWVICGIALCALLLRMPLLNYPDQTLFDEVVYANFAVHTINGEPFFDIHPPLARMLFAEVITYTSAEHVVTLPVMFNQSLLNFPFATIRLFVALFGVLLPLIVYALGRMLGYAPRIAAIPALFVVFDNALILYSRAILPDTILLFFGFLGLLLALSATRAHTPKGRWVLVLIAACALGLALSIKWIALGMFGVVIALYVFSRMYLEVIASALLVAVVYVAVFVAFVFYFPSGGKADSVISAYNVPVVTQLNFPANHEPRALAAFFIAHHRAMLEVNRDPEVSKNLLQAPGPLSWPPARSSIIAWNNDVQGKKIILTGNSLLWFVTFFALLFELAWITCCVLQKRRWPIDRNEGMLLLGYLANYIPFFFIHRPMFLYHYFTALLFLFLLMPRIVPRIIECVTLLSRDRLLAQTLTYFIGFLILVNFFLLAPTTYGF